MVSKYPAGLPHQPNLIVSWICKVSGTILKVRGQRNSMLAGPVDNFPRIRVVSREGGLGEAWARLQNIVAKMARANVMVRGMRENISIGKAYKVGALSIKRPTATFQAFTKEAGFTGQNPGPRPRIHRAASSTSPKGSMNSTEPSGRSRTT